MTAGDEAYRAYQRANEARTVDSGDADVQRLARLRDTLVDHAAYESRIAELEAANQQLQRDRATAERHTRAIEGELAASRGHEAFSYGVVQEWIRENERLRDALGFYADGQRYYHDLKRTFSNGQEIDCSEIDNDHGERARAALHTDSAGQ